MRIFRIHEFYIDKSIPANQLFDIIDNYLNNDVLSYQHLLFYFMNFITEFTYDGVLHSNRHSEANVKICKKYPEFTSLWHTINYPQRFEKSFICNYNESYNLISSEVTDEIIKIIAGKIPRPYNFDQCDIYFNGINFFDKKVTNSIDQGPPQMLLGSYIQISRDSIVKQFSYLRLCIDVTVNNNSFPLDDNKYLDKMKETFPNMYRISVVRVDLDETDKLKYQTISLSIKDILLSAEAFCKNPEGAIANFTYSNLDDIKDNSYSLSRYIKKVIKNYGYKYVGYSNFVYSLQKIDIYGHATNITIISAPHCRRIDVEFIYHGLGFEHKFRLNSYTPHVQEDAEKYFSALMDFMSNFELKYLSVIGKAYPNTPDWYFPKV